MTNGKRNTGATPLEATQPISAADIPTEAMPQQPGPDTSAADIPTQAMPAVDVPTEAMAAVDAPTEAMVRPAASDEPTRAYTVPSREPLAVPDPGAPAEQGRSTSAIDSLFAETEFQEYGEADGAPAVILPPVAGPRRSSAARVRSGRTAQPRSHEPFSMRQKVLLWTAIGLVAVLTFVALFLMGTRIGSGRASSGTAHTPKTSTAPKPVSAGALAAPGTHPWTALNGGECIQPFTSPWAATFTVVSCTDDHDAQLIHKGQLSDAAGVSYPSARKLKAEILPLCTVPSVLNYAVAGADADIQLEFSYPATAKEWASGDRGYSCFVNRSSGGKLPGDLATH